MSSQKFLLSCGCACTYSTGVDRPGHQVVCSYGHRMASVVHAVNDDGQKLDRLQCGHYQRRENTTAVWGCCLQCPVGNHVQEWVELPPDAVTLVCGHHAHSMHDNRREVWCYGCHTDVAVTNSDELLQRTLRRTYSAASRLSSGWKSYRLSCGCHGSYYSPAIGGSVICVRGCGWQIVEECVDPDVEPEPPNARLTCGCVVPRSKLKMNAVVAGHTHLGQSSSVIGFTAAEKEYKLHDPDPRPAAIKLRCGHEYRYPQVRDTSSYDPFIWLWCVTCKKPQERVDLPSDAVVLTCGHHGNAKTQLNNDPSRHHCPCCRRDVYVSTLYVDNPPREVARENHHDECFCGHTRGVHGRTGKCLQVCQDGCSCEAFRPHHARPGWGWGIPVPENPNNPDPTQQEKEEITMDVYDYVLLLDPTPKDARDEGAKPTVVASGQVTASSERVALLMVSRETTDTVPTEDLERVTVRLRPFARG